MHLIGRKYYQLGILYFTQVRPSFLFRGADLYMGRNLIANRFKSAFY
jgi:hypothetical protein